MTAEHTHSGGGHCHACYDEMIGRLSGRGMPFRQIVLTANPPDPDRQWMYDKFKIKTGAEMIKETVELLGQKGRDKITGYEGTIISVSIDLFGCVQLCLKPPMNKEGKVEDGNWFDVNRLEITDSNRVMSLPDWDHVKIPQEYKKGPASERPRL